jgi:hypothetical protein
MFTILNIINYLSGKMLNEIILTAITVLLYFYLIKYHNEIVFDNQIYISIFILLMIIDITSILIVFNVFGKSTDVEICNIKKNKSIKDKSKKSKSKKNKLKKIKSETIIKTYSIENKLEDKILKENNNTNKKNNNVKEEKVSLTPNIKENKEIVSLYNLDNENTINTYK